MALPPLILKQLWEAGYGGKVIRVPAKNQRLELKVIANEILKDAERLYESKGATFVLERRCRSDFYRSFGAQTLSSFPSKYRGSEESSQASLFTMESLGAGV